MDYIAAAQDLGISANQLETIARLVLNQPAVKAGIDAAILCGIESVKALVASVIAFVLAHLGLILIGIALVTLIAIIAMWIIEHHKQKKQLPYT